MIKGVKSFNKAVTRFAKKLPQEHLVPFHKKLVLEVLTRVVQKTPVDTGRARGNWQTTINTLPTGETGETDTSSYVGGGSATINKGLAALAHLKPYQVVWISNNVPYILALERGHSKQAPKGMIALSLREIREILK